MAQLESARHRLDCATCTLIVTSGRRSDPTRAVMPGDRAMTVAARVRSGREAVQSQRRPFQVRAPPSGIDLIDLLATRLDKQS